MDRKGLIPFSREELRKYDKVWYIRYREFDWNEEILLGRVIRINGTCIEFDRIIDAKPFDPNYWFIKHSNFWQRVYYKYF